MTNEQIIIIPLAILAILVSVVGITLFLNRQRPEPDLSDLVQTMDKLLKSVREMEAETASDRGFIRKLDERVYELQQVIGWMSKGIQILYGQLVKLNEVPEWKMPEDASTWLQSKERVVDPAVRLYQRIGEAFSEDELRGLVFQLGLEYEDLSGTTKRSKAQALVEKMARLRRFSELLQAVTNLRPSVLAE